MAISEANALEATLAAFARETPAAASMALAALRRAKRRGVRVSGEAYSCSTGLVGRMEKPIDFYRND